MVLEAFSSEGASSIVVSSVLELVEEGSSMLTSGARGCCDKSQLVLLLRSARCTSSAS